MIPVRSDGSRSGVNWMRLNPLPMVFANALSSIVFPVPGTSSNSTWPEQRKLVKISRMAFSFPTITREQLSTTRSVFSLNRLQSICFSLLSRFSSIIAKIEGRNKKDFCEKYVHICTGNRKLHFYSVRHAFHHFSIISLHTVSKRTSAPCLMSVLSVYSCGLWLFPFTLGTNIIPTSVISVSIAESWTAPLFMH